MEWVFVAALGGNARQVVPLPHLDRLKRPVSIVIHLDCFKCHANCHILHVADPDPAAHIGVPIRLWLRFRCGRQRKRVPVPRPVRAG